jgi:hypothetical protein
VNTTSSLGVVEAFMAACTQGQQDAGFALLAEDVSEFALEGDGNTFAGREAVWSLYREQYWERYFGYTPRLEPFAKFEVGPFVFLGRFDKKTELDEAGMQGNIFKVENGVITKVFYFHDASEEMSAEHLEAHRMFTIMHRNNWRRHDLERLQVDFRNCRCVCDMDAKVTPARDNASVMRLLKGFCLTGTSWGFGDHHAQAGSRSVWGRVWRNYDEPERRTVSLEVYTRRYNQPIDICYVFGRPPWVYPEMEPVKPSESALH